MLRQILTFLVWAIILAATLLVAGFFWLRTSLPQMSGTFTLSGLQSTVTIIRDRNAIAHIDAQNDADLFFAVGFVHAQDRLWQMHLQRSIASGRLAELLGAREDKEGFSRPIETDKFIRTMGIYPAAEQAWQYLDAETKDDLMAYAEGVNAFLAARRGTLPPEFWAVGSLDIRPWTPIDSLAWLKMMMWDLGDNRSEELLNFVLSTTHTSADLAAFTGTYPGDEASILPDLNALYARAPMDLDAWQPDATSAKAVTKAAAPISGPKGDGVGSNNWVISGNRTDTGAPIVANDPHLSISAPATWHYVAMSSAESGYQAIGATLPGVPYVVLGRNQSTAWGFTNTNPDVQDYFLEKIAAQSPDAYVTPGGAAPFDHRLEVIKVKGGDDIILDVRSSRHGPIMSDLWLQDGTDERARALPPGTVAAFAWTALAPDDTSMNAVRQLSQSRTVDDFYRAARGMVGPMQNIVFADVNGGTGFFAPGRVPIRGPGNLTSGLAPALGWDDAYDWQGYIAFDDLPKQENPDLLVTANAKILADNSQLFLTRNWSAPYRQQRIESMLEAAGSISMDDSVAIQLDSRDNQAADLAPTMINRVKDVLLPKQGLQKEALIALIAWQNSGFDADKDGPEATIFAHWLRNFLLAVIGDDVAPIRPDAMAYRHFFIRALILGGPRGTDASRWCGTLPATPGSAADCDALLTAAFVETVDTLSETMGPSLKDWNWGKVHMALSANSLFGEVPILQKRANILLPVSGSDSSVNVQSYRLNDAARNGVDLTQEPFTATQAAGLRHVFDLSDLDNSRFILNVGQHGNLLSRHYRSMAKDWAAGDTRQLSMDPNDFVPGNLGTLILEPSEPARAETATSSLPM